MTEQRRILILDDYDNLRESRALWMTHWGYAVAQCRSLDEAAEAIDACLPAIVITSRLGGNPRLVISALRGMVGVAVPIVLTSGLLISLEREIEGVQLEGTFEAGPPKELEGLVERLLSAAEPSGSEPSEAEPRRDLEPVHEREAPVPDGEEPSRPRRVGPGLTHLLQRHHAWDAVKEESGKIKEQLQALSHAVVALEARWDGDSNGEFVGLWAIMSNPSYEHARYTRSVLSVYTLSRAKPFYLVGTAPVYASGHVAHAIGETLAARLGVPFHFDSPTIPDSDSAHWWDSQPSGEPQGWVVSWRLGKLIEDRGYKEESGEVVERAPSPRAAHRAVIDRLTQSYDSTRLQGERIQELELEAVLSGLPEGPIPYVLYLTPTQYEASQGPLRLIGRR